MGYCKQRNVRKQSLNVGTNVRNFKSQTIYNAVLNTKARKQHYVAND